MAKQEIIQVLSKAMDKFAAPVLATGSKEALMKKGVEVDTIEVRDASLQRLREAFFKTGDILDEDKANKVITATIPTGNMNASAALVVARCENESVSVAAFFKEGLIKQHGAKRAIAKLRAVLVPSKRDS